MTERFVRHATFVIERTYDASPARVFAAWSEAEAKARWFSCHEERATAEYQLDFRVGGREINRVGPRGGPVHSFDGRDLDSVQRDFDRALTERPDEVLAALGAI